MRDLIIVVAFMASTVLGVDLTFVSGSNCTGHALYGRKDLPNIPCYNMSAISTLQPANSVILTNLTYGETVKFYFDAECQDEIYSTTTNACFNEPKGYIGSFQIQKAQKVNGSINGSEWPKTTKEIVPYGIKLSNYTGLAAPSPYKVDLGFSVFYLGVTLGFTSASATLASFALGCYTVDTTNVPSLLGCLLGPFATITGVAAALLYTRAGQQVRQQFNLALGQFNDARKRELIDSVNFDYMSGIMKRDDINAEHVGFQIRNMGNGVEQRSPLYELKGGDGLIYHITAFYDERSDSFTKHIHRAEESNLTVRYDQNNKRQISYDDIRWDSGGLDFRECQYGGSSSGFDPNPSNNWQTAYDQLNCLLTGSAITSSATSLMIDMHNTAGTIVGELQIVGYSGGFVNPPGCSSSTLAPVNEDCIIS